MAGKRWNYAVKWFKNGPLIQEELRKYGRQGWELVTAFKDDFVSSSGAKSPGLSCIFKKPTAKKDEPSDFCD